MNLKLRIDTNVFSGTGLRLHCWLGMRFESEKFLNFVEIRDLARIFDGLGRHFRPNAFMCCNIKTLENGKILLIEVKGKRL